jgi:hypothetical protein
MQYAAPIWVGSAIAIAWAAVRANRDPEAVRTGRRALALLFLGGGAAANALFLATGEDYARFADGAQLRFVAHTWTSVVVPHHELWIGVLILFEAGVGLLALGNGRGPGLAYGLTVLFHVGLLAFGWGFWVWALPMIAACARLRRAELQAGCT